MTWVLVLVGAAIGAPLRFLVDRAIQGRHTTGFPWGTFAVNMTACAVLGFVTGAAGSVSPKIEHLVGIGFCGALSTYSTFSYETLRLAETGSRWFAAANAAVSVVAGLGTVVVGSALARLLF